MVAGELYRITGDAEYKTLAARVYHNGLATAQRDNGGAGTDSIVLDGVNDWLFAKMYEAYFCCTMRFAEGLRYINDNRDIFTAKLEGAVTKKGRVYSDGDILYAEVEGDAQNYVENVIEIDGLKLSPIVKYYKLTKEEIQNSKQRILF
jgi:hypothetical protein